MSTSQGRMLQSLLSLTIRHCLLALVMRKDNPRPHVLEHGLHDVVCVMQFSCQVSFPLERADKRQATLVSSNVLYNSNADANTEYKGIPFLPSTRSTQSRFQCFLLFTTCTLALTQCKLVCLSFYLLTGSTLYSNSFQKSLNLECFQKMRICLAAVSPQSLQFLHMQK